MGVGYGWECYYKAVHGAIAEKGSLQQRLGNCVLEVHHLKRESFPNKEMFDRHGKLIDETTKQAKRSLGQGSLIATTSQMTDADAVRWLHEICDLFSDIAEAYGAAELRRTRG